jgi:hypothetical protein
VFISATALSGGILRSSIKLLKGPKAPEARTCSRRNAAVTISMPAMARIPSGHRHDVSADGRAMKRDFVVVTNGARRRRRPAEGVDHRYRSEAESGLDLGARRSPAILRGRIGTHSSHETTDIYYRRIVFIAHFNAGVRALDIRDPTSRKRLPGMCRPAAGAR